MAVQKSASRHCPQCGERLDDGAQVCAQCNTIVAAHAEKPRAPGWLIALLVAVIVGLLVYIAYLINTVIIQRA